VGLQEKSHQETKREKWMLGAAEVVIDTWPWVPSFLEIEGPDEKTVEEAAAALGLSMADAKHGSVEVVYQKYYDVTEYQIDHCPVYTFGPLPDWLAGTERKEGNRIGLD
jgi:adenylate cyclase class 2